MFTKPIPLRNDQTIIENVIKPVQVNYSGGKRSSFNAELGASSSQQQIFHLSLGSGSTPYDPMDTTVLWRYNIPTIVPGQKRRLIEIGSFSGILVNYKSQDFPTKIGLTIDNFTGYQSIKYVNPPTQSKMVGSWQTVPTNVAEWATIGQLNSNLRQGGIVSYNVTYQAKSDITWDIGMQPQLVLRVIDADYTPICGPFNNPMELNLRIVHVGL